MTKDDLTATLSNLNEKQVEELAEGIGSLVAVAMWRRFLRRRGANRAEAIFGAYVLMNLHVIGRRLTQIRDGQR